MKKLFFYILRNSFGGKGFEAWIWIKNKHSYYHMKRKASAYTKNRQSIINHIRTKKSINILFFVFTLGMWKYDGLMKLISKRTDIKAIIVPFVMPQNDLAFSKRNRDEIFNYCKLNNFTFRDSYDFDKNSYLNIDDILPDIVVYSQPYNLGYKPWLIDSYKNNSLFIYTPYGASVSSGKYFYDTYLTNIAWKIFAGNRLEQDVFIENCPVSKGNVVITGSNLCELLENLEKLNNPWPNNKKKRVIWAPHHSIDSRYSFSSSNFERICADMLTVAEKYESGIEFAFKPHPILKERLYEKWGVEKTEAYYDSWRNLNNGNIFLDDYASLFAYSDAMIHDCASFASEYLLTGKPVLYICNGEAPKGGLDNHYGLECFKRHYHGYSITEIEKFLQDVVLNGVDIMASERKHFVQHYLYPPSGISVAQNMLNQILELKQ